jgi:hypothetical protein
LALLVYRQTANAVIQANYLMSRFFGLRQDDLQAIIGLVLRFGRK